MSTQVHHVNVPDLAIQANFHLQSLHLTFDPKVCILCLHPDKYHGRRKDIVA